MEKRKLPEYCINAEFVPNGITITMTTEYKEMISEILSRVYGISIEEYLRQCIIWSINNPEKFKAWIDECREEYDF